MSILIKGMEMPENCFECPCCRHDSVDGIKAEQCNLTLDVFDANYFERWNSRAQNCPLIELPPHGRLIDADKLKSRLVLDNDSNELQRISADILKWIDIQETVIEGSET